MKSFFNTIELWGKGLFCANQKATTQEERIYLIFMQNKGKEMTPFEVLDQYVKTYPPAPITSIRRAITQLTKKNHLTMTSNMKVGNYGTANHTWTIC